MALIERLWSSMASPANLTEVGRDIDVSHELVRRHVSYLEDSYLLWRCPQRQDDQWLPRDKAQDKIYAIDPIVARLAHLRNPARVDIDPTVLTEMQIGMALRRSIVRADPTALNDEFLFYERTPTRKEIDFVARALSGAAVEGKYVEDGKWHGEVVTVNASAWKGILATRNVLDMDTDPSWAVPASFLAYSLDT
jgi:predicted AAA+ superfamily ATPase